MKPRLSTMMVLGLAFFLACGPMGIAYSADKDVPRVSKDTLKSWLGDPNLLLIDVRLGGDWQGSDKKIKGARREDPQKVKDWAATLPKDKKIVLYCA
jgi:hypothetical protein